MEDEGQKPAPQELPAPPEGPGATRPTGGRTATRRVVIGGLALVLVLVLVSIGPGGDDEPPSAPSAPTTTPSVPLEETASGPGPEVPPIDACILLDDEEVEGALGVLDILPRALITSGGREGCVWQPAVDGEPMEGLAVRIAPGEPDDLIPGGALDGVPGLPVSDVGAAAVWFGGSGSGVISVVEETSLGYVFVRLAVDRPDLVDSARLEAAKDLVANALPRFPGMGPALPEPEVDLCDLVADAEAEELLAPHREGRPGAQDEVFVLDNFPEPVNLTETGEASCKKLILTEIYVELTQGAPEDFGTDAQMKGVVGEPVSGIGDEATWFAGVPFDDAFSSPHETGVISVRQGEAVFRVVLALPDIGFSDQRVIGEGLAIQALSRIPGSEGQVVLTFERELPDLSSLGYVDNLLVREEAGEWTRGQGLVATLRLFAGELQASDVLRHEEVLDESGTGIIRLGREYLAGGTDEAAKAEIARLLNELLFARDDLPSASPAGRLIAWLPHPSIRVTAQEESGDGCEDYGLPSPCYIPITLIDLEERYGPGSYELLAPEPNREGWNDDHVGWAVEAITRSADVFEERGEMGTVTVLLAAKTGPFSIVDEEGTDCFITLYTPILQLPESQFKQWIAGDLAHCFITATFPGQTAGGSYSVWRWWNHGLAVYLSNFVYPAALCGGARCDLEWGPPTMYLPPAELATTLLKRTNANWIFFQDLANSDGTQSVLDLIGSLPGGDGGAGHAAALAAYPGIDQRLHEFAQRMSDASVEDHGGGTVPYDPEAWEIPIGGPTVTRDEPPPFGLSRLHVMVDQGRHACLKHDSQGEVLVSWRTGGPGDGGSWSEDLPDTLSGDALFVGTTTAPGASLFITATKVVDDPDDCEEDDETADEEFDCLDICDPSSFYRLGEQLAEWLQRLLGLLE